MNRQDTLRSRSDETGREGFRALIRKPGVQVVLAVAVAAQVAAAGQFGPRAETVALAPAVVTPTTELAMSFARADEVAAEAVDELAAEMRAEGYPVTEHLAAQIVEAAVENEIDPEIAFGLVRAESSFRNVATSRVGAIGLTQLMPATARWLEPGVTRKELRDPETNLRIGFRYLNDLIEKYEGDVDLALTAYNRGPGTVDRVLKRGGNPDNGYADFVRTGKKGDHEG